MVDDPRDRKAYGIAFAMLGLAFVLAVAGAFWVAAEYESPHEEIWFLPAAIGGVLVGALIPFSISKRSHPESDLTPSVEAILAAIALALTAAAAGAVGATAHHLLALSAVGTALGGVFLGLFIPSPGRRDP